MRYGEDPVIQGLELILADIGLEYLWRNVDNDLRTRPALLDPLRQHSLGGLFATVCKAPHSQEAAHECISNGVLHHHLAYRILVLDEGLAIGKHNEREIFLGHFEQIRREAAAPVPGMPNKPRSVMIHYEPAQPVGKSLAAIRYKRRPRLFLRFFLDKCVLVYRDVVLSHVPYGRKQTSRRPDEIGRRITRVNDLAIAVVGVRLGQRLQALLVAIEVFLPQRSGPLVCIDDDVVIRNAVRHLQRIEKGFDNQLAKSFARLLLDYRS